jgi:hypothetical protein
MVSIGDIKNEKYHYGLQNTQGNPVYEVTFLKYFFYAIVLL